MPITVIEEGNKSKQGNAVCPQCGEVVLIEGYYGDPPRCGKCATPYVHTPKPSKYS